MTAVVLGIDGGGTRTRASIVSDTRVLAFAENGSIKRLRVGAQAAEENLRDLLGPAEYRRGGDELAARGLYLDVPAWGHHAFEVREAVRAARQAQRNAQEAAKEMAPAAAAPSPAGDAMPNPSTSNPAMPQGSPAAAGRRSRTASRSTIIATRPMPPEPTRLTGLVSGTGGAKRNSANASRTIRPSCATES